MSYFPQIAALLAAIALFWIFATATGRLFERLKLPRVIGEIAGGILLGPTLFQHYFADAMSHVFTHAALSEVVLKALSQLGLVLLMFLSGAHLRSFVRAGERRVVTSLAIVGILIPFIVGLVAEHLFSTANLLGAAHSDLAFLLVFATAIAIASIPVISRIMIDLGIMDSSFARVVITTAVIDDVVLYVVLAIALALVRSPGSPEFGLPSLLGLDSAGFATTIYHVAATLSSMLLILFAGPIVLARAKFQRLRFLNWDNGVIVQIALLSAATALSIFLNVNPMFGALVAGMVVGRAVAQSNQPASRSISAIGHRFCIPVYFALVGFKLDLIRHFDPGTFLAFLAFACVVKAVSVYIGARLAAQPHSAAVNFAAALNARGGPGIVLASVAYEAQIINQEFFAVLVLTAIATSLLAGAWLGMVVRRGGIVDRSNEADLATGLLTRPASA